MGIDLRRKRLASSQNWRNEREILRTRPAHNDQVPLRVRGGCEWSIRGGTAKIEGCEHITRGVGFDDVNIVCR